MHLKLLTPIINIRLLLSLFLCVSSCQIYAGNPAIKDQELANKYSAATWSSQRKYGDIAVSSVGEGAKRAYIFRPDVKDLSNLPLVLFMHGWRGTSPKNFGSLIDLIVRRGAVVIYPVYQEEGDKTSPQLVTAYAAASIKAGLHMLDQSYPGLVDKNKTLYWGFSMGASIALNFALHQQTSGLPSPRALVLVAPGEPPHVARGADAAPIVGRIENLPADLPVFLVSGAADTSIGVPTAKAWAARLCHLPRSRRNFLLLPSDTDNGNRISAGHGSPGAPDTRFDFPDATTATPMRIAAREGFESSGSLNQLDFYGYWRITMTLFDYVAGGPFPSELFSPHSAENSFLGLWPSGNHFASAIEEDPCK